MKWSSSYHAMRWPSFRPYTGHAEGEEEGEKESQALGALLGLLRREGLGALVLGALVGFLDFGRRVRLQDGDALGHDDVEKDGDALGLGLEVDGTGQLYITFE